MDKTQFRAVISRLHEINTEIAKLDPTIRSQAFSALEAYLVGSELPQTEPKVPHAGGGIAVAELVKKFGGDPSRNVYLAVASFYQSKGNATFTTKEIKTALDDWGLIAPSRIDKTLQAAATGGKNLFKKQGQQWSLTVSGETHMTSEFGVRKGKI